MQKRPVTLKSMTGFARADGAAGVTSWHWEVRSVNGRGLDLRLRVPSGLEALEQRIRDAVARRIARGNVTVNLNVRRAEGATEIRLNEAALRDVMAAIDTLRKAAPTIAEPRADGVLGIRGVLEAVEREESEAEIEARNTAMLASLEAGLDALVEARSDEGRRLETIVRQQLATIERLVAAIEASPARSTEMVRQKLKEQVDRLLDASTGLDPVRLHQEAAIMAARADVEEELKRLGAHIAAARDLLGSAEPAGRRLDFLAQEFNREANTLCSKSNDAEMTRAGLEIKAVIDQMREQVQNIE
jgi:uncharacterized protein (TIGR00255 family)